MDKNNKNETESSHQDSAAEFNNYLSQVPEPLQSVIRDHIKDDTVSNFFRSIKEEFKLSDIQYQQVTTEFLFVLCGVLPAENIKAALVNECELDPETSQKVFRRFEANLLNPILKKAVEAGWDPNETEHAELDGENLSLGSEGERKENVLFHSEEEHITVTESRIINRDDVIGIEEVSHSAFCNSNGIKDHFVALLLAAAGIWLVSLFNGWSILGLILLTNPALVFLPGRKYWVFVYLKSDSTLEWDKNRTKCFPKNTAKPLSNAINLAVNKFKERNDPRKGLAL